MTMRASGLASRSASTTFRPVPSSSRMSSTAKAGGRLRTAVRASETDSTRVVSNPRLSSARPSRYAQGSVVVEQKKGLFRQFGDRRLETAHGPIALPFIVATLVNRSAA